MRWTSILCAASTVAALSIGCSGGYNSQERLRDNINLYNNALRWGQYFKAARYLSDDGRETWLAEHRDWSDDMRIADFEVVDTDLEDDGERAMVRVVVSWYRLSQSEVQTSMLAQQWEKDGRAWVLSEENVEEGARL